MLKLNDKAFRHLLGGIGLLTTMITGGSATQHAVSATIEMKDLTPKFLAFYRRAQEEKATPEVRWQLWKSMYDFAAVPPTPEGDAIARKLLDAAWPKYPSVMNRIAAGASGIQPSPEKELDRVVKLIKPDAPVRVRVLAYVGALESNAFTTTSHDGTPAVAIPVEQSAHERGPVLVHELTHAVQISAGLMRGSWERTIAEIVLSEGLAMHVAADLYPDRPRYSFVEITPGWFEKANERRDHILRDVQESLASTKSDDVMRFTMGEGPSGIDREAYFAGWLIVEHWLSHNRSLADIARISERDAVAEVSRAINAMEQSSD